MSSDIMIESDKTFLVQLLGCCLY